jgi:hypothetical protein
MRPEILARFVETLDFLTFKEVAAVCIEHRGYELVADSDGWKDGGSDLRLFTREGVAPVRYAIQASVEKHWKPKVKADVAKAKKQLSCASFLYITSRRITDPDFLPIADELEVTLGVRVSKMDQQDIAAFLLKHDLLGWFMRHLGADVAAEPDAEPPSAAEEARDAYMLFSDDSTRFRDAMVEHAVEAVLVRSADPLPRDQLASRAIGALGTVGKAVSGRVRATIDRLIQAGRLKGVDGALCLPDVVRLEYEQARLLVMAQWKSFLRELEKTLRPFLPRGVDIAAAAKRLSQELGSFLLKYREYQAALLGSAAIPKKVRQKYTAAVEASRAVLSEIGVHSEKATECRDAVLEMHQRYPLLDRLSAGEVFRNLLEKSPTSLFQALGGATGAALVFDTPVAIPMICARLFETVADPHTLSAVKCSEVSSSIGAKQLLPDVYLEECAAHLIDAGRYEPIFTQFGRDELGGSDNAYASYFARLTGTTTYEQFLRAFGYKSGDTDFVRHRELIATRLRTLFKRYAVQLLPVKTRKGDASVRKHVEQTLAHVYNDAGENERPEILKKHDAKVVQWMVEAASAAEDGTAYSLVTWDGTLFEANRSIGAEWWCMDPASAADLLSLALPGSGASTAIDLLLTIEPATVRLGGRIWDTIVHFERGKLVDAELLEKARAFKEDFLQNQRSDRPRSNQIVEAWKRWKV